MCMIGRVVQRVWFDVNDTVVACHKPRPYSRQ